MNDYKPIIIIGAPRSGTNILRDVLTSFDGVTSWPCDEINYIWRHGHIDFPSDEFIPDMATPAVKAYIRNKFHQLSNRNQIDTVVEKTCANSLRVSFVHKILPEAKYIFIVRNGVDAVSSSIDRWKAKLEIPYLLKKARFVPPLDLPYYASRYLLNRVSRLMSPEKKLATWGPVFSGMDEYSKKHSLEEVCAMQWKACVESAERDLAQMADGKLIRVKYEQLVNEPLNEFSRLAQFIGINPSTTDLTGRVEVVNNKSVGKGFNDLTDDVLNKVLPLIGDTLKYYGYQKHR